MSLSWWRKVFGPVPKRSRGSRRRVRPFLETFEDRLVPSGTYLWTGAGASSNWDDAGNWAPAAGASGTFPGSGGSATDIAQFVDTVAGGIASPAATVDGAFTVAEIDFGSTAAITISGDGNAAHALTITSQIVASDAVSPDANVDDIAAPVVAQSGVQLTNTASSSSAHLQLANLTLGSSAAISTTGSNNVTIGALTAAGANSLTNAGTQPLTVTGAVTLGSNSLSLSGTITLSGALSGSGSVSSSGSVVLGWDLAGYTGPVTITSGSLQVGDGVHTLPSPLPLGNIVDDGTLFLDAPANTSVTYNGNISGTGGVTQEAPWRLTLAGNSSYTGGTVIPASASDTVTSSTALGNGSLSLANAANLLLSAPVTPNLGSGLPGHYYSISGDSLPDPRMTSVSGIQSMIDQYGGGTTSQPFGTYSGSATQGTEIATDTSAFTTANTQGQTNTNSNGAVFNYGTGGTSVTSTAGFPTVVKKINSNGNSIFGVWTGVFVAQTTGTYGFDTSSDDGSTLFIDGNLVVNNNFAQSNTVRSGVVNLTAGVHSIEIAYYNGGTGYGLWADVELPGTNSFQRLPSSLLGTAAPILLQLASLTGSGTITLGMPNGANNGISVGGNNATSTFSGTIYGPGTVASNLPNLIKNGTGTLILSNGLAYTGLTVINAGILQLGSTTTAVTSLPTSGIVDNGNLTVILPSNGTLAYGGNISGSGSVNIQGTGNVITLSGSNTYTGPTNLGGNTLVQGAAGSLPSRSIITLGNATTNAAGTVDLNGFNASIGGALGVGTGANVITNSTTTPVTLSINNPSAILNINVQITGPITVMYSGTGSETLSFPNTYTGATIISGSTVIEGVTGALPSGSTLVLTGTGALDLRGNNLTVTSLSSLVTTTLITNSSSTLATLTIAGQSPGSFYYSGAISGTIALVNASKAPTYEGLTAGAKNTFSGGVTMASGNTVGGIPGSFGTGPIVLGTADLDAGQAISGFGGNGMGWTVNTVPATTSTGGTGTFTNGSTALPAGNTFEVTSNSANQGDDLFYDTPIQPDAGFTASYTYLDNSPANGNPGYGIGLILQADPKGGTIVGGGAGSFAYGPGGNGSATGGGIGNSVDIVLNLSASALGGQGAALLTNGQLTASPINPSGLVSMLESGHPVNIVLTYNASTQVLVQNFTDTVTGATTFADFSGVNLTSTLGNVNAFIGLAGSTGTPEAQQFVSNFTYLGASGAVTAFTNNIGGTGNLTVQANTLANAYSLSGNLTAAGVSIAPDATSTPNQPYSLTVGGSTTLIGSLSIANNGTGSGTLILNGPVQGSGATIGSIGGPGNVVLGATSTYQVVLGGSQAGGWDDLSVGGALNLAGGNLSVSYANGFAPTIGQQFTIVQSTGAFTGTFAQGSSITAGSVTYSITYNANSVVLTAASVVTASQLVVSAPSAATAGMPFNVTISATDNHDNTAGGYNGVVTLSTSASGGAISPTSVTLTNGTATIPVTLTAAGSQTITATDTTSAMLTPGTASVAVSPGAFAQYLVTTLTNIPGQTPAGNGFGLEVQATDAYGNPVSSYSGPSSVTINTSPSTTGFPFPMSLGSTGTGFTLATVYTSGSYTLSAASGTYSGSTPLTVLAGIPAKLGFVAQPASTPTGDALPPVMVAIEDRYGNVVSSGADSTDAVTISVASGPGSFLANSTLTANAVAGVATFNNLTLVAPGNYTLGAVVPTKYTGPFSSSFFIDTLQVLQGSLTSSPSGFSIGFNAPFLVNSVTPALYGAGYLGDATVMPTVTLTGPDGSVGGTLIVNPLGSAANTLEFLETNTESSEDNGTPILPDGTYVLDISGSGPNGLQALNPGGGYFDGTYSGTPGHDFLATFTVAASQDDVVWVPDTADGPLQPLEAPGNNIVGGQYPFTGGYPVYLDDSTGQVTSVSLTFNYNPTMLTIDSVSSNANLPGSTFTLSQTAPGVAVLTYTGTSMSDMEGLLADGPNSGPANGDLAALGVPLGFLDAMVANGTLSTPIYRGKDLLTLTNITINGSTTAIPAVAGNGLHLVAYVGDGNGDGAYTSTDATDITRVELQADSGFAAYPLVDPVILGDTDGDGFIPADAASQINSRAVGIMPANVASIPVGTSNNPVNVTPISNNVDPMVSIGVGGQGSGVSGGVVAVSVNIDDADPVGSTGLIRGTLVLNYDPGVFTVSAADVQLGSLLAGGGWSLNPTIDPATGQIVISISSDTPISSSLGGSLVTVDFHPISTQGASSVISLAPAGASTLGTELEDTQGTFALTLGSGASFVTVV